MPPRLRLPLLTLFTGPSCSLCQEAKIELSKIQQTLETIDIHTEQGRPWKNKYAWWIPVLHLEGKEIAKGRWNQTDVRKALAEWNSSLQASTSEKKT